MQPETPQVTLPVILDYHDPSIRRRLTLFRIASCFAGALAVSAFTMAAGAIAQGWVQNPLLEFGVWLLVAVGALLLLRAVNLCKAIFRSGWISAVVLFGLWCAVIISNQTHGRPPPTDRYFIAGFGLCCVLSAFALAFDPAGRRLHNQTVQWTSPAERPP